MLKSSPTKRSIISWLACALCLYASQAAADWRSALPEENLVGQADFRLYGFHVYEAQLWSSVAAPDLTSPLALELIYQRSIDKQTLIDTSLDEIRRLADGGLYRRQSAVWTTHMHRSFVDVKPGSRLTGVYLPDIGCRFYVDGRLQHEVDDPVFAKHFFAIWLSPKTRHPELREQLLGLNNAHNAGAR
jgi:hypothetical protein